MTVSDAKHVRAILEVYLFIGLHPPPKWLHMSQIDMQRIHTFEGYEKEKILEILVTTSLSIMQMHEYRIANINYATNRKCKA